MSARVFGIPSPWSGDEAEPITWRYRLWFAAYLWTRRARHRFGIHDKQQGYSIAPRCDWCGHRSAKQRAIAAANWEAMTADTTASPHVESSRRTEGNQPA